MMRRIKASCIQEFIYAHVLYFSASARLCPSVPENTLAKNLFPIPCNNNKVDGHQQLTFIMELSIQQIAFIQNQAAKIADIHVQ